jgi:glutathionylspermidine synthase
MHPINGLPIQSSRLALSKLTLFNDENEKSVSVKSELEKSVLSNKALMKFVFMMFINHINIFD